MAHSLAVYDLTAALLRGQRASAHVRRAALAAPLDVWRRTLGFEGCAVPFSNALRQAGLDHGARPELRRFLRDATGESLRCSILAHNQLAAIGRLARAHDIRVIVLKGAARLLTGTSGGQRSIADIDLLATPADAARLHRLLRAEQQYVPRGAAQSHHLAPLARAGSLPIEIHVRLAGEPLPLDAAILEGTRRSPHGGGMLEIPSATNMLLHTLEHATALNWMTRYRLRDVVDVAACFTTDVDRDHIAAYVRSSPRRFALETLLSSAHDLEDRVPCDRPDAWRTVRRVARARVLAAVAFGQRDVAERLFRYVGVLAEGSPATIGRATIAGMGWLRGAAMERTRA